MLKIRASYGMTGSQAFEPYQSIIMYEYYTQNRYRYNIGAMMMRLGNPDLKWQQTNQLNIGTDIVYSGTVGAIFEAAAEGVPAVAVSTQPDYLDGVESHLDRVCDFFRKHNLLSYSSLYNVNIPKDAKDILFTSQGGRYYNDTFEKTGDFSYRQRGMCVHNDQKNFTLDTDATLNGYISVTPITLDRTDYKVLSEISKLKI